MIPYIFFISVNSHLELDSGHQQWKQCLPAWVVRCTTIVPSRLLPYNTGCGGGEGEGGDTQSGPAVFPLLETELPTSHVIEEMELSAHQGASRRLDCCLFTPRPLGHPLFVFNTTRFVV